MKIHGTVAALAGRFDRLSLRERVLTSAAALVVLVCLFNVLVLERLEMRRTQLAQQLTQIVAAIDDTASTGDGAEATGATLQRTTALAAELNQATARLDSQSAGLIPPQRMTQVIHDVLSRQHGVTLISLRSLAPYALLDGPDGKGATACTMSIVSAPASYAYGELAILTVTLASGGQNLQVFLEAPAQYSQ